MQFAFSYFHYLISEKEEFDIHKVFHQYDTDQSGESHYSYQNHKVLSQG